MEPSPQGINIVSSVLLPHYGWKHQQADKKYPKTEKSFRSTTCTANATNRGFIVVVDEKEKKVEFSFNSSKVDNKKHKRWLLNLKKDVGLGEIDPQPYWGFHDLMYKAGSKLKNTFYILAENKWEGEEEYFLFDDVLILTDFYFEGFIRCLKKGVILIDFDAIDFDARTGHNHGTKFRIKQNH